MKLIKIQSFFSLLISLYLFPVLFFSQELVSISPKNAKNGETVEVLISGCNTHFIQQEDIVLTLTGNLYYSVLNISNIEVLSPKLIKGKVTIPYQTYSDTYSLYFKDSPKNSIYITELFLESSFKVDGLLSPKLVSIVPNTIENGSSKEVVITTENTNFNNVEDIEVYITGDDIDDYGVEFEILEVLSPNKIKAKVSAKSFCTLCSFDLNLYDKSSKINLKISKGFSIFGKYSKPELMNIYPDQANNGQILEIKITGQNTNFSAYKDTEIHFYKDWIKDSTMKITNLKVISPTEIIADLSIPYNTYSNEYSILVTDSINQELWMTKKFIVNGLKKPQLTSFFPTTAKNGETLDIVIKGENTNFSVDNDTEIHFYKDGSKDSTMKISNLQIISPTEIKVTVSIPTQTFSNYYSIVYTDSSNRIESSFSFYVDGIKPRIISVTPNTTSTNKDVELIITTENTGFSDLKDVEIGFFSSSHGYLELYHTEIISPTQIKTMAIIPNVKEIVDYLLFIKLPYGEISLSDALQIKGVKPIFDSIIPKIAKSNQKLDIVIHASNLNFNLDSNYRFELRSKYIFNPPIIIFNTKVLSSSQIKGTITIPDKIFTDDYSLFILENNPKQAYYRVDSLFHIEGLATPKLIRISPDSIDNGSQRINVTITAENTNFLNDCKSPLIYLNGAYGEEIYIDSLEIISATQLKGSFLIPYYTESQTFNLIVNDLFLENAFHVHKLKDELVSIYPDSANNGQTLNVIINGSNTSFSKDNFLPEAVLIENVTGKEIKINKISIKSKNQLAGSITIPYQAHTNSYALKVHDYFGDYFLENAFHVTGYKLLSVTPKIASTGQSIQVLITGFNTNFIINEKTSISLTNLFDTLLLSNLQVVSPTQLKATVSIPKNLSLGDYNLLFKDHEGYVSTLISAFKIIDPTLNNINNDLNSISIFPNPILDDINIDLSDYFIQKNVKCKILNALGQEVCSSVIQNKKNKIPLQHLKLKGTYFAQILDENGVLLKKEKIIIK